MCFWHIQILSQYIFSFEINNILYLLKSQENYDESGPEKGSEIQFLSLSDISALCQKYLHKSDLFFLAIFNEGGTKLLPLNPWHILHW